MRKILWMSSVGTLFMFTASALVLLSTPVAFADFPDCDFFCWEAKTDDVGDCVDEFDPGGERNDCFDESWEDYLSCAELACQGV